ncbi:histone-lysine N-methyltransferase [Podospora aff. communis PSN243]|uniref:Histone-lysine N-methyltransferase SET9 n=1 Tax=Podospora aff. communis PSN243 TaxID=3040156 RepID=A0AAV9G6D3_9PEZI|nr:histone-lysine N-methyltransferase [Podospora aff. communis PSN243]
MPRTPPAAAKKQPLTLAQLSSYDDILTDALIDHAYYWTTIPKNRTSYHPSRGTKEEEITKIIQTDLIVTPDLSLAEQKLLATDGLRRFCNGLKTPKEKEDFKAHLRRYMSIYLVDCPFEVNTTNRYTISTHEASVTARRYIKRNETIKHLAGIQVVITPEEEAEMSLRKKDFSLVVSSRSKSTSLFMGPARFANHDCNANARLVTRGQAAIEIIACRDIDVGEEITVSYSDSYFGEDNCECLCFTCEQRETNGWKADGDESSIKNSIETDAAQGYSLRRRRRDESVTGAGSRAPSVTPDLRPRILKSKRSQMMLGDRASTVDSTTAPAAACSPAISAKRKWDFSALTPPVTPSKKQKTTHCEVIPIALGSASSRESSASAVTNDLIMSDVDNGNLTEATSPEAESPAPLALSPHLTPAKPTIENLKREDEGGDAQVQGIPEAIMVAGGGASDNPAIPPTPEATGQSTIADPKLTPKPVSLLDAAGSILAASQLPQLGTPIATPTTRTLDTDAKADTAPIHETPSKAPGRGRTKTRTAAPRANAKSVSRGPSTSRASSMAPPKSRRVPKDYLLTPTLLTLPESAWIHCTNCGTPFVQQDAYFTRISCPRCERHSKLYGYVWPKTQPAGPGDKEERVLDHRLIHRFLDAEDEARIRGRKHWKERLGTDRESTEDAEQRNRGRSAAQRGTDSEEAAATGLRRSGRARRATAKVGGE